MSNQTWDDKTKTGTPDDDLISLTEPYEVLKWCRKFGLTEQTLRTMVGALGHSAKRIEWFLGLTLEEQKEYLARLDKEMKR